MNRYLAELPTILDKFFSGIANTTSTYIGVEGGGKESWSGKTSIKTWSTQTGTIGAIFSSTHHRK